MSCWPALGCSAERELVREIDLLRQEDLDLLQACVLIWNLNGEGGDMSVCLTFLSGEKNALQINSSFQT